MNIFNTIQTKNIRIPHIQKTWRTCLNILSLSALCLLAACAKPVVHAPNTPAPTEQVAATWQAYEQYCHVMENHRAPYRITSSLRYDSRGNGHRLVVHMWSNDEAQRAQSAPSPLRLDIIAGIGATVAQVREDAHSFLLYSPQEKKAYYHNGSRKPLFSLGVPVPFSIADLTALMHGRYADVFGTRFDTQAKYSPRLEPHGDIAYHLEPQASPNNQGTLSTEGQLILSPDGLVLQWKEQPTSFADEAKPQGWVLDIAYADPQVPDVIEKNLPSQLPLPRKLSFTYHGVKGVEHTAVVLLKERQNPNEPFTPQQIELQIPEGTAFYPLQSKE
ncbi:MAG: hypothetical protein R3Y11_03200 [Pseudomonadota bacterium]